MSDAETPLDTALRRLDRAMATLEARVSNRLAALEARGDDLFDQDRAQLAAELDLARSREKALESVAAEASAALGRAAAEVRAALQAGLEAMATVTVHVNSKAYVVGCEDGQEAHVEALARQFDGQVREVGTQVGQVGELRLFLMAALLTADELADVRNRLSEAEAALERFQADEAAASARAADALEAAALRIEALAERTG